MPFDLSVTAFAFLASAITGISTTLGAVPALFIRKISEKAQSRLTGFSAGIMLAAASFSLINPALRLMKLQFESEVAGTMSVGASILAGAFFLYACDRLIPHEHFITGKEGGLSPVQLKRIWLFVFAITLHNFPEGLAVGSGVGSQDVTLALPILTGISLQDFPEGLVVAVALLRARYSVGQAFFVAFLTGVVEAAAAMLGYWATIGVQVTLPWALAFAGGAMLYVVSDEMIPESHRKEHSTDATVGLMVGFVVMMVLDTVF